MIEMRVACCGVRVARYELRVARCELRGTGRGEDGSEQSECHSRAGGNPEG